MKRIGIMMLLASAVIVTTAPGFAQTMGQWTPVTASQNHYGVPQASPGTTSVIDTPLLPTAPNDLNNGLVPYSDLPITPAFLVIPVIANPAQQKAFSDLPVVVSTAIAGQLSQRAHNYTVLNPLYEYDEIKQRGLNGLYEKIMRDYLQAGQPNEEDLTYLTDHLASKTRQVKWVMFVQADFNTNQPSREANMFKRFINTVNDDLPAQANYPMLVRAQLYSTDNGTPHLWTGQAHTNVAMDRFGQFSRSVYTDNNINFRGAADTVARQLLSGMPAVAVTPGRMVNAAIAPSLPSSNPGNLSPADQAALKRTLDQSDAGSLDKPSH